MSLWRIPWTVKSIDAERERLQKELTALTQLGESFQLDAYGYHSIFHSLGNTLPDEPRWRVEVEFRPSLRLEQIVLVPVADRRFGELRSIGFPKRFRISILNADDKATVVADWSHRDYPNPGRLPIRFAIEEAVRSDRIRIEVYKGEESGREFFALDEVFGLVGDTVYLGENVVSDAASLAGESTQGLFIGCNFLRNKMIFQSRNGQNAIHFGERCTKLAIIF